MNRVVLTSTTTKDFSEKDVSNAVTKALDLLNFSFSTEIAKVIIKPNLCYYWDYSTGETTDPRVVSAVIDYVRARLAKDVNISIAEADASAMKTKYCFRILGYEKLSHMKNVELVNLSEGDIVERKVCVCRKEFALPINRVLLEADLVINMPKLRTHNVAGITCTLKNMFGAISKPNKYTYHDRLPNVIVGINKIVKSDICIVDGLIARGIHPKKMGVILVGDDPLATDFVAAEVMGINPWRIQHLNIAAKENNSNMKNIDLIEDDVSLKEVKKRFPNYNHFLHRVLWKSQLEILKIYAKIVGDVIPPVLEQ